MNRGGAMLAMDSRSRWSMFESRGAMPASGSMSGRGMSSGTGEERERLMESIGRRLERKHDKVLETFIRAFERANVKEMSNAELQELHVLLSQADERLSSWLVVLLPPTPPHPTLP